MNLHQNDVALQALDQLDELDRREGRPRSAERDLLHASLLAESGDTKRALDLLQRWTAADAPPQIRVEALRRIGVLAVEAGRLDEARAAAEEGARLEPNDPGWPERLAEIASRQGDVKAAVAYRRDAAREGPSVERERALSITEEQAGDRSAALASARAVVAEQGEATAQQSDLLRLAVLESESGEPLDAAALYEAAWKMGPDRDPALLLRAAREYRRGGDAEAASTLLEQLANDGAAPARLRGEALAELADLDARSGRDDAARAALERAIALGGGTWAVRQTLGDLQLRSGDARAALATYREALRMRDAPRTRLGLGYAYAKLAKPGLAVHEIDRALAKRGDLPSETRLEALRTEGYLYAEIGEAARAARAWSSAQVIQPDTEIALGLARAERLAGDPAAAARALDGVAPEGLSPAQGARYWDERSALAEIGNDRETAEADLRRAIALETTPDRDERLGVLLAESDRPEEARPLLAQALEKGGFNASWAAALGHVDSDLDDPEAASALFDRSLEADPDQLSLYEDLGYAHLRELENEKAIRRFEEAIDNRPLYPVGTAAERKALDRRIERLRREVTEVDRWISLVAYTSICFGDSHCRLGDTALVEGASESQGGAELAIRPPVIGFRNGRIFEIISRVLFQQEVNSIEPIGSSTVATLGVRYKPFRTHDFYASVEKIFAVGSDTTGNKLLRGSYGWLRGYRMQPGVSHWSYTNLYADLSYTVEYPRNWFFYAEARQGVTFNYADRAMPTPLLYLRNRNLGGDGDDDYNDLDLGVGVSARWLWNDDRYHDYRSSFEILPRIGYDAYNSDGRGWNIFLTVVVQF
ncbi:MAG: tetratricopeptide repeat protein [Deltaproteobacteria bacterium]|nr:tetratricopeptide repeat protein [Deltaproteobacteria bacterium]